MASESSSAILDLNDADGDDTEAPSVADDVHDLDGVPLIMEHGYDIAVKVDAPMKQLSTLETFVSYRVRCVCARWATPTFVRRRYNHFKVLHKRLSQSQPLLAAPPLPPLHSARQQLDRYSPSFVAIRTLALHSFLDRVAKHPIFTHSEDFRIFLTTPDDELDKVFKSDNNALNLWGLSSALHNSSESKPTNGARVKDPEFTSAADYLTSLQQKLSTLCALTTKLHKGTAALGTELMGMKRASDAWSSTLRGRCGRAASALGAGAEAGAAAAGAGPGAGAGAGAGARGPPLYRAVLPLLAAHAAAHRDKIRARDLLHAAYVSGSNTTDELHNRLEQASEALRSELTDWIPKTRSETKGILLELAAQQVALHAASAQGWERALRLASAASVEDLFKTVSKNAVRQLSPGAAGRESVCASISDTHCDDTNEQSVADYERDASEADSVEAPEAYAEASSGEASEAPDAFVEASSEEAHVEASEDCGEASKDPEVYKEASVDAVSHPLRDFSEVKLS